MLVYLDSSILVKKYFQEDGSESLRNLWLKEDHFAISQVGYSEILATIHRKQRIDRFSESTKRSIIKVFQSDWLGLIRVNVDGSLNSELDAIHSRYTLRGFDAIHLASARIVFRQLNKRDVLFQSADKQLLMAAENEGIPTRM